MKVRKTNISKFSAPEGHDYLLRSLLELMKIATCAQVVVNMSRKRYVRGPPSDEFTLPLFSPRSDGRCLGGRRVCHNLIRGFKENGFSAAAKAICPEEIRRNVWQKNGFTEL